MNINLSAAINQTGYGVASINILKALSINNSLSYFPIGQPLVDNENDYDLITQLYQNSLTLDPTAPFIKIWHQFDLAQRVGKGKYFAFPFFELDTFNQQEKLHLSIPDHIFVTSDWGKQVLINNGIKSDISIIPLGVDRNIFNDSIKINQKKDKYIFLNVGKWEVRKGHDILLELFLKAFPDQNDVELWICASEHTNSYCTPEDLIRWKSSYNHPRIKIIPGVKSQEELANLMSLSDCGIFPSRAEGWNMELLEMMSMNKPTIATNYSAHTEFCTNNNCFLVDINLTELAFDNKAFKNQGNWAKLTSLEKDKFIDYMKFVYSNNINSNPNGIKTAKEYSWTNSANLIERCIAQ